MHLLLVDTAGIQAYIFGSNRLREQVGASFLVKQATGEWALEEVKSAFPGAHNVDESRPGGLDPERRIGKDGVEAEVLYAAGGNMMLLASDEARLDDFVRRLSRKVLLDAPGLPVVTARVAVDLAKDSLRAKVDEVFEALAKAKRVEPPSAELLGLGVTRPGQSTGLPAVEETPAIRDTPGYPASSMTLAKHAVFHEARQALVTAIPVDGFVYPLELDDLGRSEGEMSYIAVVHADGNGMGRKIREIGQDLFNDPACREEDNRTYIKALRGFSQALEAAAFTAQQEIFQGLAKAVDREQGVLVYAVGKGTERKEILRIPLQKEMENKRWTGKWYLPVRPLVFGGDDLTFVSDGRLGLAMATHYLRRFEHVTEHGAGAPSEDGVKVGRLTASAGVAVVKTHYPFSRAYALAEELARSAKTLRKKARDKEPRKEPRWEGSCLDWHVATSGLSGSLDLIRRREYRARKKAEKPADLLLNLRPVVLDERPPSGIEDGSEAQQWRVVAEAVKAFRGSDWIGRRNKLKRLRESLRGGQEQVHRFVGAIGPLPQIPALNGVVGAGGHAQDGWADGLRCAYFDAVELLDLYFPVEALYPTTDDDD